MAINLDELPLHDELPVIPDGWGYKSLGDLVEDRGVSYGIVQPGSKTTDGVPIVRVNNIRNGRIDTTDMLKVGADIEAKFQRSRLRGGEVLLTLVGTLGEVAIVPDNLRGWNVARAVGVIPVLKDPGSLWVSICLRSTFIQHCIRTWATTTVQATFNLRDLAKLPIPIPPAETREAIAAVLGALDEKIELNRRMNETLEAMARALFRSWFVDFDPVRAKLDGRQPVGLDQATADLFPETFEETAFGQCPNCWEVKTLGEVIELAYGKPLKAEDRKHGPVCVYGANGPVGWHDEKLVSGPGIVIGRKGNPGVVTWAHGDFYPIDTTFYVEPIGACRSLYFLYYALSMHDLANLSADSAVPGLNRNHAYLSMQVIPSQPVLSAFDSQISPIFAAMHSNEEQARSLGLVRDTLLPKLLSGELTVPTLPSSE
jgi:type I restriction enzyme S subunit